MSSTNASFLNEALEQGVRGAIAGFVATLPMTVVMELVHRRMRGRDSEPLPPREITDDLLGRVGANRVLDERGEFAIALAGHFAYGAAFGAFSLPATAWLKGPTVVRGAAYGFALWAGSYFGWLPAMRLKGSGQRQTAARNAMMIAAHLVWGTTTLLGAAALREYGAGVALRGFANRARPAGSSG